MFTASSLHSFSTTPQSVLQATRRSISSNRLKLVAEGNNTHVVSFVGCVTVQEYLCLITELVRHGDMLAYLQNIRRGICILLVPSVPHPRPSIRCQPRDVSIGRVQWINVIQNHTWYTIEIASDCAHNMLVFFATMPKK